VLQIALHNPLMQMHYHLDLLNLLLLVLNQWLMNP